MHPVIAIGIAGFSFSFFPLMNALGTLEVGPIMFSFMNHISIMLVATFMLFTLFRRPARAFAALRQIRYLPRNVLIIGFLSGLAIYLGSVFFLFALQLMSKAGATMIAEMWPAMAIFIAPILIRKDWERIRFIDIAMLFVCIIGVVFIAASEAEQSFSDFIAHPFFFNAEADFENYLGVVLAALAAYCWSFSNVSRAHFANSLPQEFRDEYLEGGVTIREAIFTYIVTYMMVIPFVFILLFFMGEGISITPKSIVPAVMNGLFLTLTSCLYSYALLKSNNPNINVLWYFAPLLASVWLVVFGFSRATDMIVIGGGLILVANVTLVLVADRKKQGEAAIHEEALNTTDNATKEDA